MAARSNNYPIPAASSPPALIAENRKSEYNSRVTKPRITRPPLQRIRDTGCSLLTILLVTLPFWVISMAWRGPLFALGALAVLMLLVLGFAALNKYLKDQ
jgi:hypothetical protein